VTVTVDAPPATARLGASVSLTITTGSASDVLTLPTSAISTSGSRSTVALLKNGVATATVIETGLAGGSATEIKSGLAVGDVVRFPTATSSSTSFGVPEGGGGPGGGPGRGVGGDR
jgi:hypothetical protein